MKYGSIDMSIQYLSERKFSGGKERGWGWGGVEMAKNLA